MMDWLDVLDGLSKTAIGDACRSYIRNEPKRRPTPGAILKLIKDERAREYRIAEREFRLSLPTPQREEPRVSKEAAAEIMRKAGFNPKRMK